MNRNESLFNRAKAIIPGGVNSPVRAFGSVGGVPRFIKKAEGAYVWDENGTRYTDYVGSWGPAIVGHAHPEVIEAVREAALGGLSFGAPTEGEIVIAEEIAKIMPSVEQLRLVSSGTEATMTAIRLARGFTGRDKIIKFEGCYHGHSDSLLVKAGSGLLTFGNPSSAGVPADFTKHTLVLEYNNIAQLEEAFARNGDEIACVILEDIMECISPLGGVYQAGTLSGNPIAVAAGLKTLEIIQREGFYENLTALTQRLANGIADAAKAHGVEFTADSVGGMFGLYFASHTPQNYADMARSNIDGFKHFFHGMLDRNVAFGPSAYEAGFVSAAHTPELIDETIAVAHEVFKEMAK